MKRNDTTVDSPSSKHVEIPSTEGLNRALQLLAEVTVEQERRRGHDGDKSLHQAEGSAEDLISQMKEQRDGERDEISSSPKPEDHTSSAKPPASLSSTPKSPDANTELKKKARQRVATTNIRYKERDRKGRHPCRFHRRSS